MWWILSFLSAALLGCYDSFKKISLKDNAVIPVLFLFGERLNLYQSIGVFLSILAILILSLFFLYLGSR